MTTIGVFAIVFDNERHILCVKRNYGPRNWTTPGGKLKKGESPIEGLVREVKEETGLRIKPIRLLGAYSTAFNDDLVLSIEAEMIAEGEWQPNETITEMGYFAADNLPQPINHITQARIEDAFEGRMGVIRVFSHPDGVIKTGFSED
jgi:8-oxo-dGTP diphosphatase